MVRGCAAIPICAGSVGRGAMRGVGAPLHLVGHSFGGSVALKVAGLLDSRVGSLILLEPNPFYLLRQNGRTEAFLESRSLRDHVQMLRSAGRLGEGCGTLR